MALRDFFKNLVGGQPPVNDRQAQSYVRLQQSSAKGGQALSYRRLALMSMNNDLRLYLAQSVRPAIDKFGYRYDDQPSVEEATGSQIVVIDATPEAHARLHDKYDQVLRIKKSLGKKTDIYCAIGYRADFKRYPRGTYPRMLYFCMKPGDFESREPDLPVEGLDTVEGPRLYNLADIAVALVNKINEPMGAM